MDVLHTVLHTVLEEREMSKAFLNVCHLQFVRLSSFFQRFQDYSNKEDFHYFIHFTLAGFPSLFSLSVFSSGCSYFRRFVLLGEKTKPNFYSKYSRLQSFLLFPFSKTCGYSNFWRAQIKRFFLLINMQYASFF